MQDSELFAHLAEAVGAVTGDSGAVIFTVPDDSQEHVWLGAGADVRLAQLIQQSQSPEHRWKSQKPAFYSTNTLYDFTYCMTSLTI